MTATSQTETVEVQPTKSKKVSLRIVWRNVFIFLYLHAAAVYGLYLMAFKAKLMTGVFGSELVIPEVAELSEDGFKQIVWS